MSVKRPKLYGWLLFFIFLTMLPVLSALIASIIANIQGCRLDEAGAYPCEAFGWQIGSILYNMVVLSGLALATVPMGAALVLGLVGFSIYNWWRRRRG